MNLFSLISLIFISTFVFADETASSRVPKVSANTLFLFQDSNFHKEDTDPINLDTEPNGFNVREIEVQFLYPKRWSLPDLSSDKFNFFG